MRTDAVGQADLLALESPPSLGVTGAFTNPKKLRTALLEKEDAPRSSADAAALSADVPGSADVS